MRSMIEPTTPRGRSGGDEDDDRTVEDEVVALAGAAELQREKIRRAGRDDRADGWAPDGADAADHADERHVD